MCVHTHRKIRKLQCVLLYQKVGEIHFHFPMIPSSYVASQRSPLISIYIYIYSTHHLYKRFLKKCLFYPSLTSSLPSASLNEASKIHQLTPGHILGLKHPHCPHWKSWVGPATKHPPTEKSQEYSWELQRSPKHVATNMMLFLTRGRCWNLALMLNQLHLAFLLNIIQIEGNFKKTVV